MKTQLVSIEGYDSFTSLIEKIAQADTPRILLLDNPENLILHQEVMLKRILRAASLGGKELGIITKSKTSLLMFNELGIPVFSDEASAQEKSWTENSGQLFIKKEPSLIRREVIRLADALSNHPMSSSRYRQFFLIIACIITISVLVISLPSARVSVEYPPITKSMIIPFEASQVYKTVSINGNVPAEEFKQTLTIVKSVHATGESLIPASNAIGQVLFSNLTNQPVTIPKGTVVSGFTDKIIEFVTDAEAILPPASTGEVTVGIKAVMPGEDGNVPLGTINTVRGDLIGKVTVINPVEIVGGTNRLVRAPSSMDANRVRAEALASLREKLFTNLLEQSKGDLTVLESGYQITNIVSEEYFPQINEQGDIITLTITAEAAIPTVKTEDLQYLGANILSQNQPGNQSMNPASIEVKEVKVLSIAEGYKCEVQIAWEVENNVPSSEIRTLVSGKPKEEALSTLTKVLQTDAITINLQPSFWRWMPVLESRIVVDVR